ncbi:uncharacterized protein LOC135090606 isoform X2 [Scylla paramamosain]|uniref:uncharacterized protein LOC135090606 isoform X2 n=1 Tax=Scylla paramamosain TaxID=85552 RepID=UPI00308355AE
MSRGKRHEEGQGERGGAAPPWPPSAPGTSAMIPPPRDTLVHLSSGSRTFRNHLAPSQHSLQAPARRTRRSARVSASSTSSGAPLYTWHTT